MTKELIAKAPAMPRKMIPAGEAIARWRKDRACMKAYDARVEGFALAFARTRARAMAEPAKKGARVLVPES
jgi:hypothetical protein